MAKKTKEGLLSEKKFGIHATGATALLSYLLPILTFAGIVSLNAAGLYDFALFNKPIGKIFDQNTAYTAFQLGKAGLEALIWTGIVPVGLTVGRAIAGRVAEHKYKKELKSVEKAHKKSKTKEYIDGVAIDHELSRTMHLVDSLVTSANYQKGASYRISQLDKNVELREKLNNTPKWRFLTRFVRHENCNRAEKQTNKYIKHLMERLNELCIIKDSDWKTVNNKYGYKEKIDVAGGEIIKSREKEIRLIQNCLRTLLNKSGGNVDPYVSTIKNCTKKYKDHIELLTYFPDTMTEEAKIVSERVNELISNGEYKEAVITAFNNAKENKYDEPKDLTPDFSVSIDGYNIDRIRTGRYTVEADVKAVKGLKKEATNDVKKIKKQAEVAKSLVDGIEEKGKEAHSLVGEMLGKRDESDIILTAIKELKTNAENDSKIIQLSKDEAQEIVDKFKQQLGDIQISDAEAKSLVATISGIKDTSENVKKEIKKLLTQIRKNRTTSNKQVKEIKQNQETAKQLLEGIKQSKKSKANTLEKRISSLETNYIHNDGRTND